MQSIVQKLPSNLQTKWHETVVKGRRKDRKIAGFGDLPKFVEYAAESANDPIYSKDTLSNAKSKPGPESSFTNYNQKLPTSRPKSTIWKFQPNLALYMRPGIPAKTLLPLDALYATSHMTLKNANTSEKKSVDKLKSFLTEKFWCFGYY